MSLIELLVVIVFTSMFVTAVAAYLQGNFSRAEDAAPRTAVSLVTGYQAGLYAQQRTFTADPTRLAQLDGQFDYVPGEATSTGPRQVSVAATTDPRAVVGVAARAHDGRCWMAATTAAGAARGTRYGTVPAGGATPCTGQAAMRLATAAATSAGTSWETARLLP